MIKEELSKYKNKGSFLLRITDDLKIKCNAPSNMNWGGIYCIYKISSDDEELLYIGSSGQKNKDGSFKGRKSGLGGMMDRIVNGDHPKFKYDENGKRIKRHKAFGNNLDHPRKWRAKALQYYYGISMSLKGTKK